MVFLELKFKVHTYTNTHAKFGLKIQSGSWFLQPRAPPPTPA